MPVDADGRVVDKVYGARQWDGLEATALIARAFRGRIGDAGAGAAGFSRTTD